MKLNKMLIGIYAVVLAIVLASQAFATSPVAVCDSPYEITEWETTTITLSGTNYVVMADYIGQNTVRFIVNGEATPLMTLYESYKLSDGAIIQLARIEAGKVNVDSVIGGDSAAFCLSAAPSVTGDVSISLDKDSYAQGDPVVITVKNNLDVPVTYTYGGGAPGYKIIFGGVSLTLTDPCIAYFAGPSQVVLQPGEKQSFTWYQTYYHSTCVEPWNWVGKASAGTYDVTFTAVVNDEQKHATTRFSITESPIKDLVKYVKLNEEFYLRQGETAKLLDYNGMTIKAIEVVSCPVNAECVRRGEATFDVSMKGTGVSLHLRIGQSEEVFGAKISLLSTESGKAKLVVSRAFTPDPDLNTVDIGIEPRVSTVDKGRVAKYIVAIKDNSPCIDLEGYICTNTYALDVIGLPFKNDLPSTITLAAGESKTLELKVDTSIAYAAGIVTTSAEVSRYCAENSDSYASCASATSSSSGATAQVPMKDVYRFSVRVKKGATVLDTAFATLKIKESLLPGHTEILIKKERAGEIALLGTFKLTQGKTAKVCSGGSCFLNVTFMGIDPAEPRVGVFSYRLFRASGEFRIVQDAAIALPQPTDSADGWVYSVYVRSLSAESPAEPDEPEPPVFPVEESVIPLEKGWNLVSLPGKLSKFLSNTCAKKPLAFIWLKELGKYATIKEAQALLGSGFSEYLAKHAFWVYSYQDCDLEVEVEKPIGYDELSLTAGWNMIPVTQDLVGKSLGRVATNCDFQKAYLWNAQSQQWSRMTESYVFTDSNHGFIAKTSNACELGGSIIVG
ncbi:MAG: hypothetical protein V1735_01770 [Nanoarchaeota archaeon]